MEIKIFCKFVFSSVVFKTLLIISNMINCSILDHDLLYQNFISLLLNIL